jgi:hypothetical protein
MNNNNRVAQPKLKINKEQVVAGAALWGIGGAIALAGMALAGTALVTAFRQQIQQMDVPPTELARQHWTAVKHATSAGAGVWLKEQPGTPQLVTQR